MENDIENFHQNEASGSWTVGQGVDHSTSVRSENFKDIINEQLAMKIDNEDQVRIVLAAGKKALFLRSKMH